jgi:hypothetical protein
MANKKPRRQYPVEWDDSRWEQDLWRQAQTHRPVLALIDGVAREYGRQQLADEHIPLGSQDIQIPFAIGPDGRFSMGDVERTDRRAVVLTHAVHRTMRALAREEGARIIRTADTKDSDGRIRRKIIVRWDRQTRSTAAQIKALAKAVRSGSQYKLEAAWFGLTQRAHEYLSVGYRVAQRRGDLDGYMGPLDIAASLIPIPILARELLAIIVPYAVYAVTKRGRRPVHPRDEALAEVLSVFVEVSGVASTATRRGGHDEPIGPGADFVRSIETIFGMELMPARSTHAVVRAKKRLSDPRR